MNKIITISREYGAGGRDIGVRVAEQLGIPLYDRDIVRETAKASGFDLELVQSEGEDISKTESILKNICSFSSTYYHDTQDAIHDVQKAIILNFAAEGPCVIVGRCADEILREAGIDSINVFIHADDVHRAVRLSGITGITDGNTLKKMMEKKDSSRHTYYTRYTGKRWGDSGNYHLSLDSGALGEELCVKFIVEAALREE